jgi:hypothetical protein
MHDALPNLVWRHFAVPKAGNGGTELEDACAGDPRQGRFAVADGASESAFAATWAKLLVENFVTQRERWSDWLDDSRRRWDEQCRGAGLPWYLEEKIGEGAFATFLGVSFRGHDRWRATAVGDSCLFQVRGDKLRETFPVGRSQDFDNRPDLLCSRPLPTGDGRRVRLQGDWGDRDVLLLATDALAQWFLRDVEEGKKPWYELLGLQTQGHFADWVHCLRAANRARNDDMTLLVITAHPALR